MRRIGFRYTCMTKDNAKHSYICLLRWAHLAALFTEKDTHVIISYNVIIADYKSLLSSGCCEKCRDTSQQPYHILFFTFYLFIFIPKTSLSPPHVTNLYLGLNAVSFVSTARRINHVPEYHPCSQWQAKSHVFSTYEWKSMESCSQGPVRGHSPAAACL